MITSGGCEGIWFSELFGLSNIKASGSEFIGGTFSGDLVVIIGVVVEMEVVIMGVVVEAEVVHKLSLVVVVLAVVTAKLETTSSLIVDCCSIVVSMLTFD